MEHIKQLTCRVTKGSSKCFCYVRDYLLVWMCFFFHLGVLYVHSVAPFVDMVVRCHLFIYYYNSDLATRTEGAINYKWHVLCTLLQQKTKTSRLNMKAELQPYIPDIKSLIFIIAGITPSLILLDKNVLSKNSSCCCAYCSVINISSRIFYHL